MKVSKTPFRISFCGGGSDIKGEGAVVSTTIDKFLYITVNKKFDNTVRLSYSKTENVDWVDHLEHDRARETLKAFGPRRGIEVTSISDIPGGTGLGSSSVFTVGLLNALNAYAGRAFSPEFLAKEACTIEIEKCKAPIGKQDQYAAAYGGFNFMEFGADGSVKVNPIICPDGTFDLLHSRLLLLYTGLSRSTDSVLSSVTPATDVLKELTVSAYELKRVLEKGEVDAVGPLLDIGWHLKKQLAPNVSTAQIDDWYARAMKLGATGGKILGAGGGGFLLLFAPRNKHEAIAEKLKLRKLDFKFEPEGSKIVLR